MHLAQFLVHFCYEYVLDMFGFFFSTVYGGVCLYLVSFLFLAFFFFEGEVFIVPLIVRMFPRRPVNYFAGY